MPDRRHSVPPSSASAGDPRLIGLRIGNFTIHSAIGQGGMGTVYLGVHDTLPRKVAIKVLQAEIAENRTLVDRFVDEARAVSGLGHPGLVQVFDFGTLPTGHFYSMMEHLEGRDLEQALREEGPMAPQRVAWIGAQVAAAAAVAHDRGIVHRDLKPGNVYLARDDEGAVRVKLLDFGIAKLLQSSNSRVSARTAAGHIVGTPEYMAPEQTQSESAIDPRADIYALGCVLYELLTGRPPFLADSIPALLVAHLQQVPRPVSEFRRDVPPVLAQAVMRMLEKAPAARFADMRQVRDALQQVAGALPEGTMSSGVYGGPRKRSALPWIALGLVAALAVLATVLVVTTESAPTAIAADAAPAAPPPEPPGDNPYSAEDESAVARGGEIWRASCESCHGERGEGDGKDVPAGLEPKAFSDLHVPPGLLDLYRFQVVRRGVETDGAWTMPSFAEELSVDETWKVVTFIATLSAAAPAADKTAPAGPKPELSDRALVRRGARLFSAKCASCHGRRGRGDGRAAEYLGRHPADLTRGVYKLRSTPSGSLPLDEDIFRTLTTGMGMGGMPGFASLPERDRWALVAHLKTLSRRFSREQPSKPIEIPAPPPRTPRAVERGRTAYEVAGCEKCHGEEGRGDGPLADELEDHRGKPLRPPDLAAPFVFIGGSSPEDVYRTMMTGPDGTPMPEGSAFFDAMGGWDVVYFILSLQADGG